MINLVEVARFEDVYFTSPNPDWCVEIEFSWDGYTGREVLYDSIGATDIEALLRCGAIFYARVMYWLDSEGIKSSNVARPTAVAVWVMK